MEVTFTVYESDVLVSIAWAAAATVVAVTALRLWWHARRGR